MIKYACLHHRPAWRQARPEVPRPAWKPFCTAGPAVHHDPNRSARTLIFFENEWRGFVKAGQQERRNSHHQHPQRNFQRRGAAHQPRCPSWSESSTGQFQHFHEQRSWFTEAPTGKEKSRRKNIREATSKGKMKEGGFLPDVAGDVLNLGKGEKGSLHDGSHQFLALQSRRKQKEDLLF